jgi:multidrug resistance efflux pump
MSRTSVRGCIMIFEGSVSRARISRPRKAIARGPNFIGRPAFSSLRFDDLRTRNRARFALALQQAEAVVAGRRASFDQAESDLKRYRQLTTLAVSQQRQEQVLATEQQAEAAYDQAVADRAVAQLNLDRSVVYASVNGKISNMDLRPGTYVTAGRGVMALVDTDTLHVDGYFEETKLPHIQIGNRVAIRLMGNGTPLTGHVESIAGGEDRDRVQGANLLANVNPTFSWVRLAQRVPVRVSLDSIPADGSLVAGRTATVKVLSQKPIGLAWLFGFATGYSRVRCESSTAPNSPERYQSLSKPVILPAGCERFASRAA